jgi:hypothetical protein
MTLEDGKNFRTIATLENAIEAQLLDSILTQYGIPHRIRSYHDTAYDGLFQFQKGWGQVSAPIAFEKDILEVINDIRSSRTAIHDSGV